MVAELRTRLDIASARLQARCTTCAFFQGHCTYSRWQRFVRWVRRADVCLHHPAIQRDAQPCLVPVQAPR